MLPNALKMEQIYYLIEMVCFKAALVGITRMLDSGDMNGGDLSRETISSSTALLLVFLSGWIVIVVATDG